MKLCMLALGLALFLAAPVSAGEIKGKWGLSAPVLSDKSPETFAVLYAHSNRSVWAFDLAVDFRDQVEGSSSFRPNAGDAFAFACGPRLRSYRHPDDEFSFYLDRFVRVAYSQSPFSPSVNGIVQTFDRRTAELGAGLGCEYFWSRFHAGLALHSDFGRIAYIEDGVRSNLVFAGTNKRFVVSRAAEASFAVRPSIVLRAYF